MRWLCSADNGGTHGGGDNEGVGGVGWQDGDGDGEAVTLPKGLKYN